MTDKELLELAAKAAGYVPVGESEEGNFLVSMDGNKTYGVWDPLDNDAQALRLAVKLELVVKTGTAQDPVTGRIEVVGEVLDPYAATRRAIVRAAAEIERSHD